MQVDWHCCACGATSRYSEHLVSCPNNPDPSYRKVMRRLKACVAIIIISAAVVYVIH